MCRMPAQAAEAERCPGSGVARAPTLPSTARGAPGRSNGGQTPWSAARAEQIPEPAAAEHRRRLLGDHV